jgi:hypothetical protein
VGDREALVPDAEAVEAANALVRGGWVLEGDEAEAAGESGLAVHHDAGGDDGAEGRKEVEEVHVAHVVGDVKHKKVAPGGTLGVLEHLNRRAGVDRHRLRLA